MTADEAKIRAISRAIADAYGWADWRALTNDQQQVFMRAAVAALLVLKDYQV